MVWKFMQYLCIRVYCCCMYISVFESANHIVDWHTWTAPADPLAGEGLYWRWRARGNIARHRYVIERLTERRELLVGRVPLCDYFW